MERRHFSHDHATSVNGIPGGGNIVIDSPLHSITVTTDADGIHLETAGGGSAVGRKALTTPVAMADADGIVNIALTSPGACAVVGAAGRTPWKTYTIKDAAGDAATHPITYTPASGLIDGQASLMIQQGFDSLTIYSDGTNEFTM